jgi:hypothetical protein
MLSIHLQTTYLQGAHIISWGQLIALHALSWPVPIIILATQGGKQVTCFC